MKLNNIGQNSFQRAFTTHERKRVENLQLQARKELGIEETSAIIFGFNVPSMAGFNYGIGTLNSKSAIELINFLKTISQISRIQASPEGELKYEKQDNCVIYDTSPYSSGSFTLGSHTISLEKLATKEYGGLLSENYLRNLDIKYPYSKEEREYKTDYGYTFGKNRDGVVFESLKIAYENFKNQENSPLRAEFENFKKTMNNEIKQSIDFDAEELNEQREFLEFCQFIARKQHFETKKELNSKGIKYFGDCLICFSPREVKAHPECFKKDKFIGTEDPNCPETKNIQAWWANSPDYDKLGEFDENGNIVELGEFGQLLYEKFKNFMELYDGIRLDAFWQYVTPFEYDKDLNGGYSENLHDKVLKILEKASIDAKGYFSPEDFVLELVGYGTNEAKALTKNIYPHIYSTAYAQYNENPRDLMENVGYQDGKFTIGMANHDNDTIVNMSRNTELREIQKPILKRALNRGYEFLGYETENYENKSQKEKEEEDFRTAKSAEIFTTKKQYYTLTDLFGMSEKINNTGKVDENNWKVRIPSDFERFYFSQLAEGYGINFPKSLLVALLSKNSNNVALLNGLNQASIILHENGPMTEKEANKAYNEGKISILV